MTICKQLKGSMLPLYLIFGITRIMCHGADAYGQEHSTYYYQKVSHFNSLPSGKDRIVFLGNSITDGAEWQELFPDVDIVNRGISGDVTRGILDRLPQIVQRKPDKLFLMVGINDLARGGRKETLIKNLFAIIDTVQDYSPYTAVYVQSLLPVNDTFGKFDGHTAQKKAIRFINAELQESAAEKGYTYIDLYPEFLNEKGQLDPRYTNDGLHLTGEGYLLWKHLVYPYVHDLQKSPSVIPLPAAVAWKQGRFPLYKTEGVHTSDPSLKPLALKLLRQLPKANLPIISESSGSGGHMIHLQLDETGSYGKEGYELVVKADDIVVKGQTLQGVFYGLQTLFQLMRDKTFVPACVIFDQPAFEWRGLMHDVGRNYIPVEVLKKQIDEMARYKLNVLHLHLTEDIAWRLEIAGYPELTATENMQRNPGMYYTMDELKELIAYCKERYIALVPEIDMPGHSQAFTSAFGVTMQSEKGKALMKEILHKVAGELDVRYFHIGGDEVSITDKTFLPEMTEVLKGCGKQVIGWLPGGNLDKQAIRQLWASQKMPEDVRVIDSRHLYLNHIDPLGGIIKIFNRQLCGAREGDSLRLGGEICVWPDRRPFNSDQVILTNAVYPAMATFAERSWQGGGYRELAVNLASAGTNQLKAFRAFENRLLDHKKQFFASTWFPYVSQGRARWQLAGPFNNEDNLAATFEPETNDQFWENSALQEAFGSTIWLRHFFSPYIHGQAGYIENPTENSTCYAYTEVYAPADKEVNMWISFHNPSRSEQDDTAPAGEWDYKKSRIWLNGVEIQPPQWSKPARKGDKEAPYIDESFEMRVPHTVSLKKGWNKILVKLPVGMFSTPHTRLVKWMFTVAFIEKINGQWQKARGIKYWP